MMILVLELPETKRIIEAAEAQIFANTGVEVKLSGHLRHVEHDLEYKKSVLKKIIAKEFDCKWDAVLTDNRNRKLASARQVYMYLVRKYFNETYQLIGWQLNRDHTTVIHAMAKIEGYFKVGDDIIIKIENIKKEYNDAFL